MPTPLLSHLNTPHFHLNPIYIHLNTLSTPSLALEKVVQILQPLFQALHLTLINALPLVDGPRKGLHGGLFHWLHLNLQRISLYMWGCTGYVGLYGVCGVWELSLHQSRASHHKHTHPKPKPYSLSAATIPFPSTPRWNNTHKKKKTQHNTHTQTTKTHNKQQHTQQKQTNKQQHTYHITAHTISSNAGSCSSVTSVVTTPGTVFPIRPALPALCKYPLVSSGTSTLYT